MTTRKIYKLHIYIVKFIKNEIIVRLFFIFPFFLCLILFQNRMLWIVRTLYPASFVVVIMMLVGMIVVDLRFDMYFRLVPQEMMEFFKQMGFMLIQFTMCVMIMMCAAVLGYFVRNTVEYIKCQITTNVGS